MFLIFINDLPDNIISELAIFADDTSLYSCLNEKSGLFECLELAAGSLELDLSSVTEWGSQWLVTFNSVKTKLLSVNRYRNSDDIPISMADSVLTESSSFCFLGLTFSKDLNWNDYIKSSAKSAAMAVGSLYRAPHYVSPECILHLYKSLIHPCVEYCCHIWSGASAGVLGLLDSTQKRMANIIGPTLAATLQPLSHHRDIASLSLFYKYYHGCCSAKLSSLVPPPKVSKCVTRLSANSHPYTVAVPTCKKSFYSSSFFPGTSVLWNSLPLSCFPDSYDLHSFKSRANCFLSLNSVPSLLLLFISFL